MKTLFLLAFLIVSLTCIGQTDTIKPQQFRSKIISGSVGIGAGIGFVAWGINTKLYVESNPLSRKHSIKEARILYATGAAFGILGLALLTKGARIRGKYFDTQINSNSVSLIFPIGRGGTPSNSQQ